jgi:hypothetical protein
VYFVLGRNQHKGWHQKNSFELEHLEGLWSCLS